jgi:uncharacterized protein YycO
MKFLPKAVFVIAVAASLCRAGEIPLREGDIVFQTNPSSLGRAIQTATRSRFSHVGMVLFHNGRLMVFEASGPVAFTPVDSWVRRDTNRHVVVKRLRNADSLLTSANLAKLESTALQFEGKPYDSAFNWSDEKLYCSELVWKVFDRALKVDIGVLRKLRSFDLSSPEVEKKLKERYPDGPPLDETVISPQDVFESGLLVTVYEQ